MAVFQGAPLPDITETRNKVTEAPGYYTDYLTGLSQAGTTELAKTPDQLVAPLSAMQQQGYATVPDAAAAYKPGLATAQGTAAQASGIGGEDISRFMNPYTQNVVEEMERLAQQNIQRNVMPSLIGSAVGRGDLGSRRYAAATGQSLADIQRTLTGQQYGALSAGYKQAVDAATEEARLQNAVSQTQARQAQLEQELGLSGAKAMTTAGGEQQAYEQADPHSRRDRRGQRRTPQKPRKHPAARRSPPTLPGGLCRPSTVRKTPPRRIRPPSSPRGNAKCWSC